MIKILLRMYAIKIRLAVNEARKVDLAMEVPESLLRETLSWRAQDVALKVADLFDPEGKP
jgi:hypothetical protein